MKEYSRLMFTKVNDSCPFTSKEGTTLGFKTVVEHTQNNIIQIFCPGLKTAVG